MGLDELKSMYAESLTIDGHDDAILGVAMVFATGMIEEQVRKRVEQIENIAALNDGDLDMFEQGEK